MEDILSSIRRVIARDEAPAAGETQSRAATGDDILDLHDEEETADAAAPVESVIEPSVSVEDAIEPVEETVETVKEDEELVSAASTIAARQSLEALSAAIAPPPAPPSTSAISTSGRTLEDVVVDTLRPMLKDWLDANLPPLVETMVAKEIRRITGRKF